MRCVACGFGQWLLFCSVFVFHRHGEKEGGMIRKRLRRAREILCPVLCAVLHPGEGMIYVLRGFTFDPCWQKDELSEWIIF